MLSWISSSWSWGSDFGCGLTCVQLWVSGLVVCSGHLDQIASFLDNHMTHIVHCPFNGEDMSLAAFQRNGTTVPAGGSGLRCWPRGIRSQALLSAGPAQPLRAQTLTPGPWVKSQLCRFLVAIVLRFNLLILDVGITVTPTPCGGCEMTSSKHLEQEVLAARRDRHWP